MVRLLLGVSDDALKNQLIHYVMMRQSERPIETTPFAADSWPEGTEQLAKSIGLPFRGAPQSPYKFQPYFPTQKVFGGYSWRLDLIRRTKEFVSSYIADNYGFFDFIDRERLIELASRDESSLKITDFYYHLSLLKMCLVHNFGSGIDLFRFNDLDSMAVKISCLFDATATKSASHAEVLQAYNKKLDDYENALASIAEQNASQSIVAEKIDEIPILIKHFSNYSSALDAALSDFGFTDILREGLLLGTYRGSVRISGELISRESKPNRVLVSIRGLKHSSSVIGFSWSVMADFWFKYLDTQSVHSRFDILISDLNEDYQVMIEHWYASSPIFVRASCVKI